MHDDPDIASALLELRARRALRGLRERYAREPWCSPASQCQWVRERVELILGAGLWKLIEKEKKR